MNITEQGTIIVTNLDGACPDTCLLDQGGYTKTYVYNIKTGSYTIQCTSSEHTIFVDSSGVTTEAVDTLSGSASGVWPLIPPLQITTSTLLPAQAGVAYSVPLSASGGIEPYSWTITSGALPSGFSLNSSSGVISGTALSNNPYPTELMIEVTDAYGDTASKTLFLGVTPAARQLLSDADKEVCREHAMTDAGYGITFGILEGEAAADPLTEPLVPLFEFLREEFALDALYWTGLSLDAPDSNFKVIAPPAFAVLPNATNRSSYFAETEALFNFAAILDQEIGYENAMLTAINRAQGAFAANNPFWAAQQLHAASLYAFVLSELLRIEPRVAANLQAVLDANNFPTIQINQQMLSQFEQSVSENGLPQDVVQGLERLGADSTAISAIQRLLSFPNATSASFPALLTATAFEQSTLAAANAALDFAKTYAIFPF
jgi:hypothetical protein